MKITPEESKKRKLTFNIGQNAPRSSSKPSGKHNASPLPQRVWGIVPSGKPLTLMLSIVIVTLISLLAAAALAYQTKPQTTSYHIAEGSIMIEPSSGLNEEARSYLSTLLKAIGAGSKIDVRKITDINQIRQTNPESGEFYANAQNGDVLILVIDIGGAFIIRPSENKVVNFSRISVNPI